MTTLAKAGFSMEPLKQSELLEKLANNWRIRRKHWGEGVFVTKRSNIRIDVTDLCADDWEGEPPYNDIPGKKLEFVVQVKRPAGWHDLFIVNNKRDAEEYKAGYLYVCLEKLRIVKRAHYHTDEVI